MIGELAIGVISLVAFAAGRALALRRRPPAERERAAERVSRMVAQTAALAAGDTPAFEPGTDTDKLGELERNLAKLSVHVAGRERQMRADQARQELDTRLQRALAMADSEEAALGVASRAFAAAAPDCASELLLGNENETELHLATVGASGAPGCPVASPGGCPAIRSCQTLHFSDPDALDVCPHLRGRSGGPKRAACIPLAPMRGVAGVLHVTSDDGPVDAETVARLEVVGSHVGSRLRMLHVLGVFQKQAETDALTGLFNRRSFEQRISGILQSRSTVALAIVDLDHFKRLNDTHGHAVGDQALRVFARVLRDFAKDRSGLAARLGGEEFVVALVTRESDPVEPPFEALREALRRTLATGPCPPFTVSMGVSIFPTQGATLSELLGAADRALYQAKSRGRDRVVVHSALDALILRPVGNIADVAPQSSKQSKPADTPSIRIRNRPSAAPPSSASVSSAS